MAGKPLWRRAFDGVERRVAGPLESGVQSDAFADAVSLLVRSQDRLAREFQRRSGGMLGMVNLPVGSDVKRLSQQVASLERQVRELSKQLEDERAPVTDGGARSRRRSGAGAAAAGAGGKRRAGGGRAAGARRSAGGGGNSSGGG